MTTNEFYYNGTKKITSEQAHALKDKSLLVVSDKSRSLNFLNNVEKDRTIGDDEDDDNRFNDEDETTPKEELEDDTE